MVRFCLAMIALTSCGCAGWSYRSDLAQSKIDALKHDHEQPVADQAKAKAKSDQPAPCAAPRQHQGTPWLWPHYLEWMMTPPPEAPAKEAAPRARFHPVPAYPPFHPPAEPH